MREKIVANSLSAVSSQDCISALKIRLKDKRNGVLAALRYHFRSFEKRVT